jgi:hypothetical protein
MNLIYAILAIAAVAVSLVGECLYPFSHSSNSVLIDSLLSSSCLIHHIYTAESAFATTIAATDADDVAIMSIESEGNFNQAMALGNMLRGTAGVVSLRNNKDSFNEVEASLAWCKLMGSLCGKDLECCEYK